MVDFILSTSTFLKLCISFAACTCVCLASNNGDSFTECQKPRMNNENLFTDCGGVLDAPHGVISTPNFPGPYATPIYCEWLIRAKDKKKIIIYFTQYFMKDSFCVTEYANFHNTSMHLDRHDLGRMSWQYELESLVAHKPFVLIQFMVESIGNRHLRVLNKLLDVYGFNITYEIVDEASNYMAPHSCSVSKCSYLGHCRVSADYSTFKCDCAEDFFGPDCQYGPYCDPDNGINRCQNDGLCKYTFGSLINECECVPGFYGAYCEISAEENPAEDPECLALQCSQFCDVDHTTGVFYCFCSDGYKMDDNGTCIPIARYRMDVTLELSAFVHVPEDVLQDRLDSAKQAIMLTIRNNGVSTISKFNIQGLRNATLRTVLQFFFYCKVSEIDNVDGALVAVVALGRVGGFHLWSAVPKYKTNPELQLLEVTNYDVNSVVQGKLLTLVCAAKGSPNITFRWYKDMHRMDPDLTKRHAWETLIPHTVQSTQLSVLNIDSASPFDKGVFTCEVFDFGEGQYESVQVDVLSLPMVELDPMSATVPIGELVSIKCLSSDNKYEWFKNGVMIDPNSRTEFAEDVLPLGQYLVVQSVRADTEYMCRVTNEAGSANVTAYIYALHKNETNLLCPRNYEGQVMWQNTSGGHFNVQPCPTEQGGYARRNCQCDAAIAKCSWDKPNFAKCQSLVLIKIHDELELIRLGYQKTTLKAVFDALHRFMLPQAPVILYSGDIDMVASILRDLLQHMTDYPQLVYDNEMIEAVKLMELISAMLVRSAVATHDEKQLILVGQSIMHITRTLFSGGMSCLLYSPVAHITTDAIELKVVNQIWQPMAPNTHVGYTRPVKKHSPRAEEVVPLLHVKFDHLIELLSYRDTGYTNEEYAHQFVSRLHSVSPYPGTEGPPSTLIHIDHRAPECATGPGTRLARNAISPISPVTATNISLINLCDCGFDITQTRLAVTNTTICLSWTFDSSNLYRGGWRDDNCTVVASTSLYTRCMCKLPGHFAAAVILSNVTVEHQSEFGGSINIILAVGYSVALCIIFLALFLYLRNCGNAVSDLYRLHCNFICCILCCTTLSLLCVLGLITDEALMVATRTFLQLLYTVAFASLFIEVLHIFLIIYEIHKLVASCTRYLIFIWGFAVCVTFINILLGSLVLGFGRPCDRLCWLSHTHWTLYAFIFPVAFIILGYCVVLGACVRSLRKWVDEWRYLARREYMRTMGMSASVLALLALSTALGIDIDSSSPTFHFILHTIAHVCLMICVLIHRCILDKKVPLSGSFRAYMKTEKVCDVDVTQEVDSVSKYYDDVNRAKYTVQRKRELSALLGSSDRSGSGSDGSGDTRCTSVSVTSRTLILAPKGEEGDSVEIVGEGGRRDRQGTYSAPILEAL